MMIHIERRDPEQSFTNSKRVYGVRRDESLNSIEELRIF